MEKSKNELWRDRNKLFVAGIPSTADDDALYAKFEPFGEMFQSKVVYDNKTNRSRGFGFITYANYESCLDAIEALNNKKWDKRILNVRLLTPKNPISTPETTLVREKPDGCTAVFIGNMPYEITEAILRKLFEPCGAIKAIRFCQDIKTNEFRGFGYVQYYDGESCEKAVAMNGTPVMGRPLRVDYDDSKPDNNGETNEASHEEFQRKLKKGKCHKFQQGLCDRGDSCKFAHVIEVPVPQAAAAMGDTVIPQVTRPEPVILNDADPDAPLCLSFQKGKCKRGSSCRFRHMSPGSDEIDETPVDNSYSEPKFNNYSERIPQEVAICKKYLQGRCTKGASCRFSHKDAEMNRRTEYQLRFQNVCYNWQKSASCVRGDDCTFVHDQEVATDDRKAVVEDQVVEVVEDKEKKEKKKKRKKSAEAELEVVEVEEKKKKKRKKSVEEVEEKKKKKKKKSKDQEQLDVTDTEVKKSKKKHKKKKDN